MVKKIKFQIITLFVVCLFLFACDSSQKIKFYQENLIINSTVFNCSLTNTEDQNKAENIISLTVNVSCSADLNSLQANTINSFILKLGSCNDSNDKCVDFNDEGFTSESITNLSDTKQTITASFSIKDKNLVINNDQTADYFLLFAQNNFSTVRSSKIELNSKVNIESTPYHLLLSTKITDKNSLLAVPDTPVGILKFQDTDESTDYISGIFTFKPDSIIPAIVSSYKVYWWNNDDSSSDFIYNYEIQNNDLNDATKDIFFFEHQQIKYKNLTGSFYFALYACNEDDVCSDNPLKLESTDKTITSPRPPEEIISNFTCPSDTNLNTNKLDINYTIQLNNEEKTNITRYELYLSSNNERDENDITFDVWEASQNLTSLDFIYNGTIDVSPIYYFLFYTKNTNTEEEAGPYIVMCSELIPTPPPTPNIKNTDFIFNDTENTTSINGNFYLLEPALNDVSFDQYVLYWGKNTYEKYLDSEGGLIATFDITYDTINNEDIVGQKSKIYSVNINTNNPKIPVSDINTFYLLLYSRKYYPAIDATLDSIMPYGKAFYNKFENTVLPPQGVTLMLNDTNTTEGKISGHITFNTPINETDFDSYELHLGKSISEPTGNTFSSTNAIASVTKASSFDLTYTYNIAIDSIDITDKTTTFNPHDFYILLYGKKENQYSYLPVGQKFRDIIVDSLPTIRGVGIDTSNITTTFTVDTDLNPGQINTNFTFTHTSAKGNYTYRLYWGDIYTKEICRPFHNLMGGHLAQYTKTDITTTSYSFTYKFNSDTDYRSTLNTSTTPPYNIIPPACKSDDHFYLIVRIYYSNNIDENTYYTDYGVTSIDKLLLPPVAVVQSVEFKDQNSNEFIFSGNVTIEAPDSIHLNKRNMVAKNYQVYLGTDQIPDAQALGSFIIENTSLSITDKNIDSNLKNQELYLTVYTANEAGKAKIGRRIQFIDLKSTSHQNTATNLFFADTDPSANYIKGTLEIKANYKKDIQQYNIYLSTSDSSNGLCSDTPWHSIDMSSIGEFLTTSIKTPLKTILNTSVYIKDLCSETPTHFLIYTYYANNDYPNSGESTDYLAVPILDISQDTSLQPPEGVSFSIDNDPIFNRLSGIITVNKASTETNITHYSLYFADSTSDTGKTAWITDIAKTGDNVNYDLENAQLPDGTKAILAYSLNSTSGRNESEEYTSVEITDNFEKAPFDSSTDTSKMVQQVSFKDYNYLEGKFRGTLKITQPVNRNDITAYHIYWGELLQSQDCFDNSVCDFYKKIGRENTTNYDKLAPLYIIDSSNDDATVSLNIELDSNNDIPDITNFYLLVYSVSNGYENFYPSEIVAAPEACPNCYAANINQGVFTIDDKYYLEPTSDALISFWDTDFTYTNDNNYNPQIGGTIQITRSEYEDDPIATITHYAIYLANCYTDNSNCSISSLNPIRIISKPNISREILPVLSVEINEYSISDSTSTDFLVVLPVNAAKNDIFKRKNICDDVTCPNFSTRINGLYSNNELNNWFWTTHLPNPNNDLNLAIADDDNNDEALKIEATLEFTPPSEETGYNFYQTPFITGYLLYYGTSNATRWTRINNFIADPIMYIPATNSTSITFPIDIDLSSFQNKPKYLLIFPVNIPPFPSDNVDSQINLNKAAFITIESLDSYKLSYTTPMVAAGAEHSCYIKSKTLYCTGSQENGRLGNNKNGDYISTPESHSSTVSWEFLAADHASEGTEGTTCGIKNDNKLYCWGGNTNGQIGNGSITSYSSIPIEVTATNLPKVRKLSIGATHVCALSGYKEVYCWGNAADYRIGDGKFSAINQTTPKRVAIPYTVTDIAVGAEHACAILEDDKKVVCWGNEEDGRLGQHPDNFNLSENLPFIYVKDAEAENELLGATQIAAGENFTCVITENKNVKCWGKKIYENRSTADNLITNYSASTIIINSSNLQATQITAGKQHLCVIINNINKEVMCAGYDDNGQLGHGLSNDQYYSFGNVKIDINNKLTGVSWISAGIDHTCAYNGKFYCWGNNDKGQLGIGDTTNQIYATEVSSLSN